MIKITNISIKLAGLVVAGTLQQTPLAAAGSDPSHQDPRLHVAMKLDMPSAGASVAPDGRKFLVIVRLDGSAGPRVVEWQDGTTAPYPSGQWNGWKRGDDPAKGLVRVNAQRIGPDGKQRGRLRPPTGGPSHQAGRGPQPLWTRRQAQ